MSEQLPNIIRLLNVSGFDNRANDVVYCRPLLNSNNPSLCVYFGGDVQDFTENMLSHRDNKNHVMWNLEDTAKLLQDSFPKSHIMVVRPVRMDFKTFSCYENFVPCTHCGVPEHVPLHNGLQHLQLLMQNVSIKIKDMTNEEFQEAIKTAVNGLVKPNNIAKNSENLTNLMRKSIYLSDCDIILIGFSKGCVVLNQFLHEFEYYKENSVPIDLKIVSKIREMYWLDGGHSGGKNTWITSPTLLENLAKLEIQVSVHVTPYQISDERRPWIKKEEKTFSDTLKKLGVPIQRMIHFNNIPASIENHFNVLTVFKNIFNS